MCKLGTACICRMFVQPRHLRRRQMHILASDTYLDEFSPTSQQAAAHAMQGLVLSLQSSGKPPAVYSPVGSRRRWRWSESLLGAAGVTQANPLGACSFRMLPLQRPSSMNENVAAASNGALKNFNMQNRKT